MKSRVQLREVVVLWAAGMGVAASVVAQVSPCPADISANPESAWLVDLGSDSAVGNTWFSVDPTNPNRALVSVHTEWNTHSVRLVACTPTGWSLRGPVPYSREFTDRASRFLPDGSVLFSSRRPGSAGDWDLWRVPTDSDPRPLPLPSPVNTEHRDYHGSATRDGTIYFVSTRPGTLGDGDIYRAIPGPTGYTVEHLPAGINTELWEVDVFVSPDEGYLLFARTDSLEGLGGDDIFVTVRTGQAWSTPRPLPAPINSGAYDYGAFVTADGSRLFFTSHRGGVARIYQADAADFLDLTPESENNQR